MSPPPALAATAADETLFAAAPAVRAVPVLGERTLLGIGFIVLSTMFFTVGDIAAKSIAGDMHGLEITWFRFLVFAGVMLPGVLLMRGPRGIRTARPVLQVARGVAMAVSATFFIIGLGLMPVAENTGIAFLSPIFITALSIPLLKETVGVRRWAAALVGFAGVLMIVRPGSDAFQVAAVLPILAALVGALGTIVTRVIASDAPETTLAWTGTVGFLVLSMAVPFVWTTPDASQFAWALASGLFSTIGHVFVVLAFRNAPASTLAPFTYVQLLFAGMAAYAVFGDVPEPSTIAGLAVIAGSGLYTAHRERVRASSATRVRENVETIP
jgi:drug/metabolite transporter (DMT)-like permease